MSWYREVAKAFLNAAILTLGIFVFGFVTNPSWYWWYFPLGTVLAAWFVWLSWWAWRKGGEDRCLGQVYSWGLSHF